MKYQESEIIELKQIATKELKKDIIAFANTQGGTLYVGISDSGEVTGVENPDDTIQQITNMVHDSIVPDLSMFIHYNVLDEGDKKIISADIQRGTHRPYYLSGKGLRPEGVYVRQGNSSYPATAEAIRQMIKETDGDSFECMRSLEQELSFRSADEEFKKRKAAFGESQMRTLGITNPDGLYTNLGLLLSDQCPFTVKTAVFNGTDQRQFQDRKEFSGSLLRQMNDIYKFIDLCNQLSASFDGLYRVDRRDYPEEALREALLNTLVHRDYSYAASSLISIYGNRIEFTSIGGLMPGITRNDIMIGLSVCRNQRLAGVFYRLRLIEAYGTGIRKIMDSYSDSGMEPTLEITEHAFKIILPNLNYTTPYTVDSGISDAFLIREEPVYYGMPARPQPPTGYRAPSRTGTHGRYSPASSLPSDEERVLALAGEQKVISRKDVEALLDIGQTAAGRILKRLVEQGALLKDGRGPRTRYYPAERQ